MVGLAVQNFVSAAVGIAVLVAFIRGLASRSAKELGNFYVDLTRVLLYILLPLSVIGGLFLVSQGALQNLSDYTNVKTITGLEQTLAQGPVASQEAIKLLGTNGGGFFNVNSAMPFENPSWLTNFVEMLMILVIPAGLTATYGRMVGNRRQGWAVFAAMMTLFIVAVGLVYAAEVHPTAAMDAAGVHGPNLEGKEQRFGIASSSLFVAVTTVASCGAVNAAIESLSGLGGAIPTSEMRTGEVIFGGVGSGLYGMLLFVILGVFISGLMVGRTPEFLGKKIEAREIKLDGHRHDRRADDGAGRDGGSQSGASGASRRSTTAAPRASRRRSTPTSRRATTTARRSRATPATCSPTAPTTAPSGSPSPTCSAAPRCSAGASCR